MHALQLHNFEGMLFEDMNPLDDEDNSISRLCDSPDSSQGEDC